MRPMIWLFVAVLAAALVLVANRKIQPAAPVPEPEDARLAPERLSALDQSLEERRTVLMARFLEKDRTAKALLRGEITLDEAADRFRALTRDDPTAIVALERWYGATGDEIYYRNVLKFAGGAAFGQPPKVLAVVERLEEDFRSRFPRTDVIDVARP
jgi:hypothetical protein